MRNQFEVTIVANGFIVRDLNDMSRGCTSSHARTFIFETFTQVGQHFRDMQKEANKEVSA